MKDRGVFLAFPDDWYTPVMQYVVLLQNATPATHDFERFLASDKVRQILDDYGYATPELQ
jgi:ABC-type molybdate transport system substrate-binding protein